MKRFLTIILFLLSGSIASLADSPLTSTDFAVAYYSSPMVALAKNVKGNIPTKMLSFLADSKSPVDERLAVVNQLGWEMEGTSYSSQLGDFLKRRHAVNNDVDLADKLDAGTLAVYAYATAMSDYFNVDFASFLGHRAVEKDKGKSLSVAMVAALIDAQSYMDGDDWSKIYTVVADVIENKTLHRDMKQEAIDIIMEYIDLYKEYK